MLWLGLSGANFSACFINVLRKPRPPIGETGFTFLFVFVTIRTVFLNFNLRSVVVSDRTHIKTFSVGASTR